MARGQRGERVSARSRRGAGVPRVAAQPKQPNRPGVLPAARPGAPTSTGARPRVQSPKEMKVTCQIVLNCAALSGYPMKRQMALLLGVEEPKDLRVDTISRCILPVTGLISVDSSMTVLDLATQVGNTTGLEFSPAIVDHPTTGQHAALVVCSSDDSFRTLMIKSSGKGHCKAAVFCASVQAYVAQKTGLSPEYWTNGACEVVFVQAQSLPDACRVYFHNERNVLGACYMDPAQSWTKVVGPQIRTNASTHKATTVYAVISLTRQSIQPIFIPPDNSPDEEEHQ